MSFARGVHECEIAGNPAAQGDATFLRACDSSCVSALAKPTPFSVLLASVSRPTIGDLWILWQVRPTKERDANQLAESTVGRGNPDAIECLRRPPWLVS